MRTGDNQLRALLDSSERLRARGVAVLEEMTARREICQTLIGLSDEAVERGRAALERLEAGRGGAGRPVSNPSNGGGGQA